MFSMQANPKPMQTVNIMMLVLVLKDSLFLNAASKISSFNASSMSADRMNPPNKASGKEKEGVSIEVFICWK